MLDPICKHKSRIPLLLFFYFSISGQNSKIRKTFPLRDRALAKAQVYEQENGRGGGVMSNNSISLYYFLLYFTVFHAQKHFMILHFIVFYSYFMCNNISLYYFLLYLTVISCAKTLHYILYFSTFCSYFMCIFLSYYSFILFYGYLINANVWPN